MASRMPRVKLGIVAGIVLIVGACVVCSCAPAAPSDSQEAVEEQVTDAGFDVLSAKQPYRNQYTEGIVLDFQADLAENFPYQFYTFATEKERDGVKYGHSTTQGKVEGPWLKNFGGQPILTEDGLYQISGYTWDKETNTWSLAQPGDPSTLNMAARCYACKSTAKFNELYDQYGNEAFGMQMDQEAMDFVGGDFWGCGSCHEDGNAPAEGATSQSIFFNTILGDDGETLSDEDKACGQCHNGTFITGKCVDPEYFENARPFRYGFDADSLIRAQIEDGDLGVEAGIPRGGGMHADMEVFQGSNHDINGLTCVSCHMPTLTAEDGTVFTDHDASQSPLENTASLELCLTCHKTQGIESTDEMIEMVRGKQAEAGELETELREKLDMLEEHIAEVEAAGTADEATIKAMYDALTTADFYTEYCVGSYAEPGIKIAHNPTAIFDYLNRADKLIDDAMAMA